MARIIVFIVSLAAVLAGPYEQLRDRPFDSPGSRPFVGRSGPAVSIEDSQRFGSPQFSSGSAQSSLPEPGTSFTSSESDQFASDGNSQFSGQQFGSGSGLSSSSQGGSNQFSGQQFGSGLSSSSQGGNNQFSGQQFGSGLSSSSQGGNNQFSGQQFGGFDQSTGNGDQGQLPAQGQSFIESISASGFSNGQGAGSVLTGSGSSLNAPIYEEHLFPKSGPLQITSTVTNFVTKTHTLRVPATSDVWITSVTMVNVPVTHLSTRRTFVRDIPDTVTSLVRITSTPVSVLTQTVEVFPTKTLVSVFTNFITETETVELWQPIQHLSTSYDVMTRPILETQTLLQRVFRTVTATRTVDVTSTRQIFFPRAGRLTVPSTTYPY